VVGGATLFALDCDMPTDFVAGFPNEGEAINAPAARQLMKSKRLVFMNVSSSFIPPSELLQSILSRRDRRARS
jgi:hypothetical protein